MDAFEIKDRRFAAYILANAPVEELATGFRWLEGPVWFGDANCLLFQDLPRNRTMRWSEETGVSVGAHTLYAVFLNRRGAQWP